MKAKDINSKLEYLGLNLSKIPEFIKKAPIIDFESTNQMSDKNYKVYRYLKMKDISIMLTPANRLTDPEAKCSKANPLFVYLQQENKEHFKKLLEIINNTDLEDIEKIEETKKETDKNIPIKVKFNKDYLWQIHYSDKTKKYFMLVPTEEQEFQAFLFLLKKQLEKNNDKIFVPVCNQNYSNEILNFKGINELENYLYFFTKEWPSIYQVYDKKDKPSIQIIGKSPVIANINSDYKIVIENKEEGENLYKLVKALFLLQSELPYYFKFEIKVDENANIHFFYKEEEIQYLNLAKFIQHEYEIAQENLEEIKKIKIELLNLEQNLKEEEKILNNEFLQKQKQISTYLECKKTFIGKVKFFFKHNKKKKDNIQNYQNSTNQTKVTTSYEMEFLEKSATIDILINICKILVDRTNEAKLKQLDTEKIKTKIDILKKKIENADLYIQEIEEHKKSIFEFWKFTSKDEANQLNEGFIKKEKEIKIKKSFDLNTDLRELSYLIDGKQKNLLTREELNSVYLCTTNVIEDINRILKGKSIFKKSLNNLKQEWKESNEQGLNIFGEEKNEVRILANKQHRETNRNKFAILGINENLEIDEYTETIKKVILNLEKVFKKLELELDIPVYTFGKDINDEPLKTFYINPRRTIETTGENIKIHILNLKRDVPAIGFSNIVYFNNTNRTLPQGMDISTGILINTNELEFKLKKERQKNVLALDEKSNSIKIIELNILEYDL